MHSDEKLKRIAGAFDTEGRPESVRPITEGLINDTYMLTTDTGRQYVLQRVNTAVFTDVDVLQSNLKAITDHIRRCLAEDGCTDPGRHCLTPVRTLGGGLWTSEEGEAWRMNEAISDCVSHSATTPAMAEATGRAIGEFHAYFTRPGSPALRETIPGFHDLELRLRQLGEAAASDRAGRLHEVSDLVAELQGRAAEMTRAQRMAREGRLPRRVTHCDTKVSNILFDRDGNPLCVIDLDTTMPGFVLSDFGDFIRTAANTGAEDDRDLGRVGVDMEIFRAFARGYVEASRGFLTDTERSLLPYGAQMLTYMQSVRFLTDYLNGDTYYKTTSPDHNLARTLAQVALLRSIDEHLDEMNRHIATL